MCQEKIDNVSSEPSPGEAGSELGQAVLRHLLSEQDVGPLAAVGVAQGISRGVEKGLATTVAQARAAGHTWAEIGQVLGMSRQAAFQRFGRPADPRTGRPMAEAMLPDAGDRAVVLLANVADGRLAEVCNEFDALLAQRLDAGGLAEAWARVIGTVGRYEGLGQPVVYQAGDYTVADVPLSFEAGEITGRVSFDRTGRVAGLFYVPTGRT